MMAWPRLALDRGCQSAKQYRQQQQATQKPFLPYFLCSRDSGELPSHWLAVKQATIAPELNSTFFLLGVNRVYSRRECGQPSSPRTSLCSALFFSDRIS